MINLSGAKALRASGLALTTAAMLVLAGCGGGSDGSTLFNGGGTTTTTPTPTATPIVATSLIVNTDKTSLKTGSTDVATLTVTALDANNAVLPGATIIASASSGILSSSAIVTGTDGKATFTFNPGSDRNNRTQGITFTNGTSTASTAIVISGTKITPTAVNGLVLASGASEEVDATVVDGTGAAISGATVSFSTTGAGSVGLSATSAVTDASGIARITVTGAGAGAANVSMSALSATSALTLTIGDTSSFSFTSPATSQSALLTSTPLTVTVKAPNSTAVQFVTTTGHFIVNGSSVAFTQATVNSSHLASVVFQSDAGGVATITAYDASNPSTTASVTVAVSAPVSQTNKVVIQALPAVLAPTTGSQANTSTLTAMVTDINGQGIAGVPVAFTMTGQPNGGEAISPQVVITSSSPLGQATATFTSGSLPTTQGVPIAITATALLPDGTQKTSVTPANIVIGGTAGSVSIGQSSQIGQNTDQTAYQLPMSVIVADSNGNPVANTKVSLSVWPIAYSIGAACGPPDMTFANEDINENLTADAGEIGYLQRLDDVSFTQLGLLSVYPYHPASSTTTEYLPSSVTSVTAGRSSLLPSNSAAGTLPATVTTDANGVANFTYTYLKSNAIWIVSRIRATTLVQGTQTSAQSVFRLGVLEDDVTTCHLPPSPFNADVQVTSTKIN